MAHEAPQPKRKNISVPLEVYERVKGIGDVTKRGISDTIDWLSAEKVERDPVIAGKLTQPEMSVTSAVA